MVAISQLSIHALFNEIFKSMKYFVNNTDSLCVFFIDILTDVNRMSIN